MRIIEAIPSKSDAHRALICAALSKLPCEVVFGETSMDIEATKRCLKALNETPLTDEMHCDENGSDKISVKEVKMYCGESGSTLRFLLPIAGALGRKSKFIMEGRLSKRPLSPLYEELIAHGCKLSPQGSAMLEISGQLEAGEYTIPGNVSSQYISGLLFALPLLEEDSTIEVEGRLESKNYVDMTVSVLKQFGINIEEKSSGYLVPGNQIYLGPSKYIVEGDWSNACFWLAAGALTPEGICCRGLSNNTIQGDNAILDLLRKFGAEITEKNYNITVNKSALKGIDVDASQIPDMVPVLALIGAVALGKTTIKNAGRLRIKESDRLASISQVLGKLGANIRETEDGLIINGKSRLKGGSVDSHNDHRIAMMAAIASIICEEKVVITGSDAVNKSYPGFFRDMKKLSLDSNVERK